MIKAVWLAELETILERGDFQSWWSALADIRKKITQASSRLEEQLAQINLMEFRAEFAQKKAIDALYRAGELEDQSAQLLADASEIENKSYEAVANFESQRVITSDLFAHMGAREHNLLLRQAEVRTLQNSLDGVRDNEQKEKLTRLLRQKEKDLVQLQKEFNDLSGQYERGRGRKNRTWEEVEQMWVRSLEINLSVAERKVSSKRARWGSEQLFKAVEGYKQSVNTLKLEADESSHKLSDLEKAIEDHRSSARRLFGCLVGEDFLYWPRRENNKEAYCMPLDDHPEGYNIELKACAVYLVGRQRGVDFVEPVPPGDGPRDQEDKRIDGFFEK